MTAPTTTPRCVYGAASVAGAPEPFDRVQYRLFYPAQLDPSDPEQRQTGVAPPVDDERPWPVAVMVGGMNVNPDGYRWLAERFANAGIATVVPSYVEEVRPGDVGLSPGLDIDALRPDTAGTRPSATVIGPLLVGLDRSVQIVPLSAKDSDLMNMAAIAAYNVSG